MYLSTTIASRLLFFSLSLYTATPFAVGTESASCKTASHSNSYYELQQNQFAPIDSYLQTRLPGLLINQALLTSISGHRESKVVYFDTPDLLLFNSNTELSHTLEKHQPKYIKEREYVIYKNYQKTSQPEVVKFQVRRYKTNQSQYDKHPLVKIIRRKERPLLFEKLNTTPGLIETLKQSLEITHNEKVYMITHMGKAISQISLSKFYIENFGVPVYGNQLSFEFAENSKLRLDESEDIALSNALCILESEIVKSLSLNYTVNKLSYANFVQLAKSRLPIRDFILQYPLLFNILQSVFFIIIGSLLLVLLFGRYNKRPSTRYLIRGRRNRS